MLFPVFCDLSTLELFLLRTFEISSSMPTPGDAAEENMGSPRSLERDESPMVNEVFFNVQNILRV